MRFTYADEPPSGTEERDLGDLASARVGIGVLRRKYGDWALAAELEKELEKAQHEYGGAAGFRSKVWGELGGRSEVAVSLVGSDACSGEVRQDGQGAPDERVQAEEGDRAAAASA